MDKTLVQAICEDCGFTGDFKDFVHPMSCCALDRDDVSIEPREQCPKCGSENVITK